MSTELNSERLNSIVDRINELVATFDLLREPVNEAVDKKVAEFNVLTDSLAASRVILEKVSEVSSETGERGERYLKELREMAVKSSSIDEALRALSVKAVEIQSVVGSLDGSDFGMKVLEVISEKAQISLNLEDIATVVREELERNAGGGFKNGSPHGLLSVLFCASNFLYVYLLTDSVALSALGLLSAASVSGMILLMGAGSREAGNLMSSFRGKALVNSLANLLEGISRNLRPNSRD
jgi:hypothetical protein